MSDVAGVGSNVKIARFQPVHFQTSALNHALLKSAQRHCQCFNNIINTQHRILTKVLYEILKSGKPITTAMKSIKN